MEDLYEKFCVDEVADFLYFQWKNEAKNKEEFKTSMAKYSVKKKKQVSG